MQKSFHPLFTLALHAVCRSTLPVQAAVAATVDRHGRIDVLVDNAGRTQVGAIEETTGDELRALFDLHVFGPFALTRAVLPQMRERGSGAIVMMSSVGGQVVMPGFGVYCGTKFALEGVAEALAAEVQAFGIKAPSRPTTLRCASRSAATPSTRSSATSTPSAPSSRPGRRSPAAPTSTRRERRPRSGRLRPRCAAPRRPRHFPIG